MSKWSLHFIQGGWEDYMYWQKTDRKMIRKLNYFFLELQRTPFKGTGKPEPLKGDLAGLWSRRINEEHRLVYYVTGTEVRIVSYRYHYSKT